MEKFLLNERVINEIHMQPTDLKQRTKYIKKYEINSSKPLSFVQKPFFDKFYLTQKYVFACNQKYNQSNSIQRKKKIKQLLSDLSKKTLRNNLPSSRNQTTSIKQGYFIANGIKRSLKQLTAKKGSHTLRTCSLVHRQSLSDQFRIYDADNQIKFKNSPRCFIQPQHKSKSLTKRNNKSNQSDKQNNNSITFMTQLTTKRNNKNKQKQKKQQKITIKQRIDKQVQQQLKKRRFFCRSSTNKSRKNNPVVLIQQQMSKAQMKIYSELRQNRSKMKKITSPINFILQKNKPFSNGQLNKNTVKILKKYHCDNMVYFNKFVSNK